MSFCSFFGNRKGNKSQSKSQYKRTALHMEALEERALLSAVPLTASEYADLRAEYAEFNLPANMADLNVITLDLAQGDGLSQLKSAISTAGTTTKSDLIVVRSADSAYTAYRLTYSSASDELKINIDASQYGSVTIVGLGTNFIWDGRFVLDADEECRVMTVSGEKTIANLGGIAIIYGDCENSQENNRGAGILNKGATVTVSNCLFDENNAYNGGAIFSGDNGNLNVVNCEFQDNYGVYDAGGIYNGSGIVTVTNSTFSGTLAETNCGGCIVNNGTMTITDCTISESEAELSGGAIYNRTNATLTVANSVISNNTANGSSDDMQKGGGGIYNLGILSLNNSTVANNVSSSRGSGIYNNGNLTISDSTISGNSGSLNGGGIYNLDSGSATVTNSTISDNTSSYGGGVYNSGNFTLINSSVSRNSTNYSHGGGICNYATLTVVGCKISDNSASEQGGGIRSTGTIKITNSVISGNTASKSGGGVLTGGTETSYLSSCTITGNTSHSRGGGIYCDSNLLVSNSIVVANNASSDNNDVYGSNSLTGYNNISSFTGWSGSGNNAYNSALPLFVNAGVGDYRLCQNSQAIDKGSNAKAYGIEGTSTDRTGNPRFDGTIDIGAYEFQKNVTYSTVITTLEDSFDLYDGEWSLREAISYAPVYCSNGYPTITFAEGLEGTITLTRGELELREALILNGDGRITIDADQKTRVIFVGAGTAEQPVIFNGLTFQNGYANGVSTKDGAGIYLDSGNLIINNSAILENTVAGTDCHAGGIFNRKGTLSINNSVVSGNKANYGGGIYNYQGTTSVINSEISENASITTAASAGGGLYNDSGTLKITNSTITKNIANQGHGIYNASNTSGSVIVNNSIVVGNSDGNSTSDIYSPNVAVNGSNNLTTYRSWNGSGNIQHNTAIPLFVNAAEGDYHLIYSEDSQAIDKGSNALAVDANGADLVYDLDNNARIVNDTVDIGAYEYAPEPEIVDPLVNAFVVFQDSLTTVDIADELPTGVTSVRAGKTVYAEIWVKDVESTDPGIIGGYLNMLYDNEYLTVQEVTYGTVFTTFTNDPDLSVAGHVDLIGGAAGTGVLDKGDDEWVRLATVSFVAEAEGVTTVSLDAPEYSYYNLTRADGNSLTNEQINYGAAELEITQACPMDVNGDGVIAVADYALLSMAWLSTPDKPNWNPACDFDGDGVVAISDYTFLSINWMKSVDDPTIVYPQAKTSAAAVGNSEITVTPDNQIAYNADTIAEVRLAALSSKSPRDTAAETPESLTQIDPGDNFFVEIWVRNINGYDGTTLCGLTGGYLNMSYPSDLISVAGVTYGSVFSQFNGYEDLSEAGLIDLIGGVARTGVLDQGDDEWVRLATVEFTTTVNGSALIESLPPTVAFDNLTLTSGKTLKNDEISFGTLSLSIGSAVVELSVQNDFVKTTLNNPVVIDYRENDTVANWSEMTVQFGDASYGEYTVNADGTIVYTPEEGFYGTDALSYVLLSPSGTVATGAIVINVGLPIAASVQKTSGSHSPSSSMSPSVPALTDWDNCCIELWAQDVNSLNPGETTITMEYNPAVYEAPYFSACADGVALSVSQSSVLPNGNVELQLTAQILEPLTSQTNNLFLGTVVLAPSMDEDAGVVDLTTEPVCSLDGSDLPTTVEAMPYDLIRNGSVDVNDFVAFATVFGYSPDSISSDNPLYAQTVKSDFNKDGKINADDFILFAINFGAKKTSTKPAPLASAVAETVNLELEEGNFEVIDSPLPVSSSPLEVSDSQLTTSNSQLIIENRVESSMTLLEAYSDALLDLYDNFDRADLSEVSDVLAESRMELSTESYSDGDSQKASSDAVDAVLEDDLLAINWN